MFMTSIPEIKLYLLLACISLEINMIRYALQLTIRHLVTNGLTQAKIILKLYLIEKEEVTL